MGKKKIDIEKEYYRLWIEYLKQSKDYKEFCPWWIKKRRNPNLSVPEKFHKDNGSTPKEVFNFITFGNIHDTKFSFDEWFKKHKEKIAYMETYKSPKAIEDFTEHIGGYIDTSIDSFKRHFKREPSLPELKEWLINHVMRKMFDNSLYLMVDVNDDTVKEQFNRLVKEKRKNARMMAHDLTHKRFTGIPILKYETIEEIRTYLNVYVFVSDLIKKQGYVKRDAMKKAIENFTGESIEALKANSEGTDTKANLYSSIVRKYNMYYTKAERIIKNAEHRAFPVYTKRKAKLS